MRLLKNWLTLACAIAGAVVLAIGAATGGAAPAPHAAGSRAVGKQGNLGVVVGHNRSVVAGPATANPLAAHNITVDSQGDLYIIDAANEVIEKVTPDGTLSIVAGVEGQSGTPTAGPATSSRLDGPNAIAVDGNGTLYISDSGNDKLEKVTSAGTLSIVPSIQTQFVDALAVDPAGDLFLGENGSGAIVKEMTPSGTVTAVAGTGVFGAPTDGGTATTTKIGSAAGIALDSSGNLYIADPGTNNYVVEEVDLTHNVLHIIAGSLGHQGAPSAGKLSYPDGVASTPSGTVYVSDQYNNEVVQIGSAGALTVVTGTGAFGAPTPGTATSSELAYPKGVAVGPSGQVYVADETNDVVEQVSGGTVSFAAGALPAGGPVAGPATQSGLAGPNGVAVDSAGNEYIADTGNRVVDKVAPDGTLSIFAGEKGVIAPPVNGAATMTSVGLPTGIAVDGSGNVYISDQASDDILKVTPDGTLSRLAGNGVAGSPMSGSFNNPAGLAVDGTGHVYVADTANNVVEKINPDGSYTVIAGTGTAGTPVAGTATAEPLKQPDDVTVDTAGNVYIADTGNNLVEKITSGQLSIVAGTGLGGAPAAGGAKTVPVTPTALALDTAGNLLIADNDTISPAALEELSGTQISILSGNPSLPGFPTPGLEASSQLIAPAGLAEDAAGDLFIADHGTDDVTEVFGPPRSTATAVTCAPASITAGATTSCTVTVTDTGPAGPGAPTGTVPLTASSGTLAAASCTLSPTAVGASACAATFTPAGIGTATISSSYAGDVAHLASSGTAATVTTTAAPPKTTSTTTTTRTTTPTPGRAGLGKVAVHGTTASAPVACAGQTACAVTLTLSVVETLKGKKVIAVTAAANRKKVKAKKKLVVLGSARATVAAGKTQLLTITLNAAGKRLLAKHSPLKVALTAAQGSTRVGTVTLTFKKPKPKRKHHTK